jgi:hypothetical protein
LVLDLLQSGPGLDSKLVEQLSAGALVAGERIGLAARSVQRQHQLTVKALP